MCGLLGENISSSQIYHVFVEKYLEIGLVVLNRDFQRCIDDIICHDLIASLEYYGQPTVKEYKCVCIYQR